MVDVDVVATQSLLGECPVWSEGEQLLYWTDIDGKTLHRLDPATGTVEDRALNGRPGSFALTDEPGHLLVALELDLVWFAWDANTTQPWVTLEKAGTPNRLNDGRCDPAGRFVVGSMTTKVDGRPFTGSLHQIEPDGSTATLLTDVGIANGTAFDSDLKRAYFADSWAATIWVWDYDVESGVRSNRRVFVDYSELPGAPDGACIDESGCYWSASAYGSALVRITPEGDVDRRVELPVLCPTMPSFGGPNLDTLYVTSLQPDRNENGGDEGSGPVPNGSLLALDVGVRGRPEPLFAGSPPALTE